MRSRGNNTLLLSGYFSFSDIILHYFNFFVIMVNFVRLLAEIALLLKCTVTRHSVYRI